MNKISGAVLTVAVPARGQQATYTSAVTTTGTTTFSTIAAAKSSAVKVGLCATAVGTADSTGAVAAKAVAITQPTDAACTFAGFGRGRGQGGTGQGNGGQGGGGQGNGGGGQGQAPVTTSG